MLTVIVVIFYNWYMTSVKTLPVERRGMLGALGSVRVLDFTRMYAGPFCTLLLKDLGAEVIKVEIVEGGDAVRTLPPQTEGGEGYIFVTLNRGKKSVTLNLTTERGRQLCRDLVAKTDVLVENFACGVMDKLGLGYEELKEVNPQLVYASVSGFGHTGPRRFTPAFDIIAQAMSGFMSVTGFPDGPPTKAGPAIADFIASFYAATGIMAALLYRKETGRGQKIDISMQDAMWAITAMQFLPFYSLTGESPPRLGNGMVEAVPFNVYPARDGHAVIAIVTVGQWQQFLRVIEREDLLGVQKYATQSERVKHRLEVDALVAEWTRSRTVEEIVNTLGEVHLPCGPILTVDRVASDPQILSRQMVIEVEQMVSGRLKVPGSVFKLSETPGDVSLPAPFLGEHNREVYSELLALDEAEIAKLAAEGVI